MSPTRPLAVLRAALVVAASYGCAAKNNAAPGVQCSTSSQCSGGRACVAGMCVTGAAARPLDVEIVPNDSPNAPTTEVRLTMVDPQHVGLSADRPGALRVSVAYPPGSVLPSRANIVVAVQPLIPGRPDRVFEVTVPNADATGSVLSASVPVPLQIAGQAARVQVVPLPPADQQSPPLTLTVPMLPAFTSGTSADGGSPAAKADLPLMAPPDDTFVRGTLLDALLRPLANSFVARAYQMGALVSNAPLVNSDGTFAIVMPSGVAGNDTVLSLTPLNATGPDPSFTSAPFVPTMLSTGDLGQILMPAYNGTTPFNVGLIGNGAAAAAAGVVVRAISDLDYQGPGSFVYARSATSDDTGTATLPLIAIGAHYEFDAIPPNGFGGSPYAINCLPEILVNPSSPGSTIGTVNLIPRATVSGTVRSSGGAPVAGVSVTASPTLAPTATCTNIPPAATSATSDANGRFTLLLDPGTFQLDYDPPSGASVPRATELVFSVSQTDTQISHDVNLPVGTAVQGTVVDADNNHLAFATLRFYKQRCDGTDSDCFGPNRTAPLLVGQAMSDAAGQFAIVLPPPD